MSLDISPAVALIMRTADTFTNEESWYPVDRGIAPEEYSDLRSLWLKGKPFPVSTLYSDKTLFGRKGNVRFRAWHDTCHFELNAPFTAEGEARVCALQQQQVAYLGDRLSSATDRVIALALDILEGEIMGQLAYEQAHGGFPEDQIAFMEQFLQNKGW